MPNNSPNQSLNQPRGFGETSTLTNPFFTSIATAVTNSLGSFLFYGSAGTATSSIGVSDYNNHAFQASVQAITGGLPTGNGSGSFTITSTVDGVNFTTETSIANLLGNTSSILRLTGRRAAFLATYSGSGNSTGSLYLISGQ